MPVAFEHQDSMSAAQWRTGPTRKQRSGRCGAPRSHINADSSCSRSSSSSSEEAHAPPRKQKQGRKVMRMVGGWLARSRSSRGKRSATFHSLGEPMVLDTKKVLTPATPQTHLSTVTTDQDTETEEESGPGHRKRVSFDLDVTVSSRCDVKAKGDVLGDEIWRAYGVQRCVIRTVPHACSVV